jgi:hypothetical protein
VIVGETHRVPIATAQDHAKGRVTGEVRAFTGFFSPVDIPRTAPGETTYLDRVPGAATYTYGVQAVNAYGTVSASTESPPFTVG